MGVYVPSLSVCGRLAGMRKVGLGFPVEGTTWVLECLFALLVYIPPAAGCEDPEPQKLHLVASPLGAQPQSDRILRVLCGRLVPGAHFMPRLDALKRACRRSSLQASRSARRALSGCCGRC